LPSIDLDLPSKLQDPEYRERFFLAEASAEIARQLIRLRKLRGLSQAELAELANTQQPAVSRAEQADYQNWSFNTLRKLTNAMTGRLRVVIEPLEDVIAEYREEIVDDEPKGTPDLGRSPVEEQSEAFLPKQREPDANLLVEGSRDQEFVRKLLDHQSRPGHETSRDRGKSPRLSGARDETGGAGFLA
jgi:transcriptional regulator with XRE-family HTH domain